MISIWKQNLPTELYIQFAHFSKKPPCNVLKHEIDPKSEAKLSVKRYLNDLRKSGDFTTTTLIMYNTVRLSFGSKKSGVNPTKLFSL